MNFDLTKHLKKESKNVVLYSITTLVTSLGSFIIIPLYWKKLSPLDYGYIAIAEILSGFLALFLGLNLDQGITRFYHEWQKNYRKFAVGTLLITSWISILCMFPIILLIVYKFHFYIFPNLGFEIIKLALIISFLSPLEKIPNVIYRMEEKPYLYSLITILTFIINNSIMIYLIFFLDKGVIGYFYAQIITKIILTLINTFFISNFISFKFDLKYLKTPLFFSLKFIPSDFISVITSQGDKYFVQLYLNIYFLGLYSLCQKFGALLTNLHVIIKLVYVPFLIKTNSLYKNGKEIISELSLLYLFPLFIGFVGLSIFSNDIIIFINNAKYFNLNEYLFLVYFSILIPMLYIYLAPGIYLSKKNQFLIYPSIISSGLFLILTPFFIKTFGLHGLIFAKIISGIIYLSICIYFSNKLYNLYFKYKPLIYILSLSILTVTLENSVNNLFLKISFFLIYILLLFNIFRKKINYSDT